MTEGKDLSLSICSFTQTRRDKPRGFRLLVAASLSADQSAEIAMHDRNEGPRRRRDAKTSHCAEPPKQLRPNAPVVALLEEHVRGVIETAANGAFKIRPSESLTAALAALRDSGAFAMLVSPSLLRHTPLSAIRRFLSQVPSVTVIAVLGADWPDCHGALLHLGAGGVRQVVNLAEREGWNRLRTLIDESSNATMSKIVPRVAKSIPDARAETHQFLSELARLAPTLTTVRALAGALAVNPNTLMSRFCRVRLPSPKIYLAMTRLLYAASYFEMSDASIATVADDLGYSSPQSFGRHVRGILGVTAGEFRKELNFERLLRHFIDRLIVPYEVTLRTFTPLGPGPLPAARPYRPAPDQLRMAAESLSASA